MRERIGVLGGAFDPPHIGHLILGETARQQLALDRVLFMPTGQPPHKDVQSVSAAKHRIKMTELAIAGNDAFAVSSLDIDRPAPHYTATLRPYLLKKLPKAEFVLLIGGDSLRDLPLWHSPQRVVREWDIAVLPRPDYDLDWEFLEEEVPGVRQATTILDGPSVALSSTEIRRWANGGRSLRYLMPGTVVRYIRENAFYTTPTRSGFAEEAPSYSSDASITGPA